MSKNNSGSKKRMQKSLQIRNARKAVSKHTIASTGEKIEGNRSVTRKELFELQKVLGIKVDTALMSTAALAEILVNKDLCTWDEFKEGEKKMLDNLNFIRKTMAEAVELMGKEVSNEDMSSFIYEKAVTFGIDKGVLSGIFGINPSSSRIINPKVVRVIKPGT